MLYRGCPARRWARRLLPASIAAIIAGAATAHEVQPAPISCTPALPFFCANIHIGCAGRSRLATQAFDVIIQRGRARVVFADGEGWPVNATQSGGDLILRPEASRDWIRIEPNGRYSHRIYRNKAALMTRGTCRYADAP